MKENESNNNGNEMDGFIVEGDRVTEIDNVVDKGG